MRINCLNGVFGVVACAGVLALAAGARANVVTIGASQDVTLFGATSTNNNNSSGPGMFVGSDGTSPKRGIIQFDVASAGIPAGATITGVTMTLYLGMWAGSSGTNTGGDIGSRIIRLYDVTTGWSPSTNFTTNKPGPGFGGTGGGATPNTGEATWNFAHFNTTPWITPGGDFVSTESADTSVDNNLNSPYTWSSAQMAADVQAWLANPSSNHGWLLKNDEEGAVKSFRAFYTAEGAVEQEAANGQTTPVFAPSLTITFTTPTPEPMSGLMMAAGAGVLMMRRRVHGR